MAYNQPVTRSDVDSIRGVDSSYAMTSLIDKNLIEVCGRMEAPGRPMLYATTDKFLRVFGLSSLSELPKAELPVSSREQSDEEIPSKDPEDKSEEPNADETIASRGQ